MTTPVDPARFVHLVADHMRRGRFRQKLDQNAADDLEGRLLLRLVKCAERHRYQMGDFERFAKSSIFREVVNFFREEEGERFRRYAGGTVRRHLFSDVHPESSLGRRLAESERQAAEEGEKPEADAVGLKLAVAAVLAHVTDKQAEYMILRYGLNGPALTLEEIGERSGVSRQAVEQSIAKAFRKLRDLSAGGTLEGVAERVR